jgi:Cysteine-rich secretory protein family
VSRTAQLLSILIAATALFGVAPAYASAPGLEARVLEEINSARTHPAEFARLLRDYRDHPEDGRTTIEGPAALDEAIEFLERQAPLPPLKADARLARSAAGFARDQGPQGYTGHASADGATLSDRIHRQQVWSMSSAEAISYGYENPRDVVRQLIVDDGVSSRGHRKVLFDTLLRFAGVGCGPHRVYGAMCVIDFSGPMIAR